MNKYKIEQKILTLSECAVMSREGNPSSFIVDDVEFSHWEFSYSYGWLKDAWMASSVIEAPNFKEAFIKLRKKLSKIIPRIALISQSYIEYISEPFIIHKIGSDEIFFRDVQDRGSVGLMFMEEHEKALNILLLRDDIPEAFYYYWNDAVNTTGYSAKLLLMFSAIEALVKKDGKKDWELINKILGEDLVKKLFGTPTEPNSGLRHRLVHGEYFNSIDSGDNYLDQIHKKVIEYFNNEIFSEELIDNDVVGPQRHFFGNKDEAKMFIRLINPDHEVSLKDILEDFSDDAPNRARQYEGAYNQNISDTY